MIGAVVPIALASENVGFYAALAAALVIAGAAAYPINRWLISRGEGHAVVHAQHGHRQSSRPIAR